jgi:hypothetical protein
MNKPNDSTSEPTRLEHKAEERWMYPLLFGVQTIGVAILICNAVPHYREILSDPGAHQAEAWTLVWSLSASLLIQIGFWINYRVRPPLPQLSIALLGHVLQFVSRMSFVLATSIFGFVFLTPKPGFHMPASRYVVTIVALFSLYCYTQELTRLGKAFIKYDGK